MVLGILMLFSIFYYTAGELFSIFYYTAGDFDISGGRFTLFLDNDGSEVVDRNRVVVVLYIGSLM